MKTRNLKKISKTLKEVLESETRKVEVEEIGKKEPVTTADYIEIPAVIYEKLVELKNATDDALAEIQQLREESIREDENL